MAVTIEQRRARLGGELAEVTCVRHSIGDWMRGWGLSALTDDVELVASELITNAILHARGDVEVVLERRGAGVRVVVRDGCPDLVPARQAPPPAGTDADDLDELARSVFEATTTGRGLLLVDAFSDSWGVNVGPSEKEVWAEVGTGCASGTSHTADRAAAGCEGVTVHLLDVPVRLVLFSAVHMDDLVRELQTTDFDSEAPIELAALGEQLVNETLAQREPVRVAARRALQQRTHRFDVDIEVPPAQVGVLRRFVSLTDQVEQLCQAGVLLTQPPSEEVTAFRRWYVDELDRQVGGAPPSRCPFAD